MRIRLMFRAWPALPCALLLCPPPAHAEPAPSKEAAPCIDVQVNGERVRAWDCLQQKLTPTPATARRAALPESERLIRQPGNQLLQYNLEGTRQRMGDAFGRSVVPQRPTR